MSQHASLSLERWLTSRQLQALDPETLASTLIVYHPSERSYRYG